MDRTGCLAMADVGFPCQSFILMLSTWRSLLLSSSAATGGALFFPPSVMHKLHKPFSSENFSCQEF